MDGSDWVALASVLTTAGLAAFTAWWQRRGERERAQEQSRERQSERWVTERLSVYLRFLRAADESRSGLRYRVWWMQYALPAEPSSDEERREIEIPKGAHEPLQECAAALSEARLFAPAAVVSACSQFIEAAREIEHFSSQDAIRAAHGHRPKPAPEDEADGPYAHTWDLMRKAADEAIAAMREDLRRDPLPAGVDLMVDPSVLGC